MLLTTSCLLLSACMVRQSHEELAKEVQCGIQTYPGEHFDILGCLRGRAPVLHVYIEGDGKAWRNRRQPSANPTPDYPVGLHLAASDSHEAVFYLARPCQYVEGDSLRNCSVPLWTSARFAEPVISDMSLVIDQAKKQAGADSLVLVGYSGGGAVALLLAERRNDVDQVVTIAGNVDHAYWTKLHEVSPLRDSLNPADLATELQSIPQIHIVSNDDDVIPPSVVRNYISKMTDSSAARVVVIEGVDHSGEWHAVVPDILEHNNVW